MLHTFWLPPGTCIQVQTKARQTHIASVPWNSLNSRWLKALPGAPAIQVGPEQCFKSSPPVIPLSSLLPAAESWVCRADCWVLSGMSAPLACAGVVGRLMLQNVFSFDFPEVLAKGLHMSTCVSQRAFSSWTQRENPTCYVCLFVCFLNSWAVDDLGGLWFENQCTQPF